MNFETSFLLSGAVGLSLLASGSDLSPTLEVLPLNSTLSNVTIPRYDQDNERVAYLKADLMEILADGEPVNGRQAIMVDCTGIQLRIATEQVDGHIAVDMQRARYRLTPGILTVQEQITAKSPQFSLTGNGGVFHLDTRRGFIFGPLHCNIFPEHLAQNSTMPTPLPVLLATTSLLASNIEHKPPTLEELAKLTQLAEPARHFAPTSEELRAVQQLAKPSRKELLFNQNEISAATQSYQDKSQLAQERLEAFAKDASSESLSLLIQNPPPAKPAANQGKPPLENPDLTIHCEGGCFFDGNENLLVLLRDVVVKEKRFTLKAQQEVKVFFLEEEANKNQAPKEKKDGNPGVDIGNVESLVATGGVHFSGVDEDGNPVEASAATAFYNDQTKTLILKDGQPTFWRKMGEAEFHFQAEEQKAEVRIVLSDEGFRADTSKTGWKFGGSNLPLNQ